jgi:threonine dehydrogenase-like Zn-dependent dehydrogenase
MKALEWYGTHDIRLETAPDPLILNPRDAIVRITLTAICGSDLHLYDGYIPTTEKGDILGHEFMGEVVETGSAITTLRKGDRVVVAFPISCGTCYHCLRQEYALCDNSNPNADLAEKFWGHSPAGMYGYSHLLGGYPGGQAEYVRVPYADVGTIRIPDGLADEQVLFLSDVFPAGYQAALYCDIQPEDTVAVWGCGPVGQFAIQSARLLGAKRVIAIDRFEERLLLAKKAGYADVINYEEASVLEALNEMTGGRGPDKCIDAVGMEAHGTGFLGFYDKARQTVRLQTDRPTVLREAIQACRKGGIVSIPGVYGGLLDKINFGAAFQKGLTFRMGQTHVQKYMHRLLEYIGDGEIDPSFVITHRLGLEDGPRAYEIFRDKEERCVKVVLKP